MASIDDLYTQFMDSTADNPRAQRELRRLLGSIDQLPEQKSTVPLLPIDEMEERLECIRKIEAYCCAEFTNLTKLPQKQYRLLNDIEISGLLLMDLHYLRFGVNQPHILEGILKSLFVLPATLKIFFTKKLSNQETDQVKVASNSATMPSPSQSSASDTTAERRKTKFEASGKAKRNDWYTSKREELDQKRCVITGTSYPAICRIIPFAANSTDEARDRWDKCLSAVVGLNMVQTSDNLPPVALKERVQSLFASEVAVSDRYWNTISLSYTLHDWWGRAYFGLKCLSVRDFGSGSLKDNVKLCIQFQWMQWRQREIGRKKPEIPLGRTKASVEAAFHPYCGDNRPSDGRRPIIAMSRPGTGFSIESGDVFEVLVPRGHMDKMILAFDLQWAMVKLLAISGCAEAVDDLPDHPDFLDKYWVFPGTREEFQEAFLLSTKLQKERYEGSS
ncbi:hypothetical protein V8F06_003133 [Rhypophila decipiens]